MKKKLFPLFIGLAVLIISLGIANATDHHSNLQNGLSNLTGRELIQEKPAGQDVKIIYTCSMHPSITSEKPGKCPTCGMNLEKKEVAKVTYVCPMHPEVTSDKA